MAHPPKSQYAMPCSSSSRSSADNASSCRSSFTPAELIRRDVVVEAEAVVRVVLALELAQTGKALGAVFRLQAVAERLARVVDVGAHRPRLEQRREPTCRRDPAVVVGGLPPPPDQRCVVRPP